MRIADFRWNPDRRPILVSEGRIRKQVSQNMRYLKTGDLIVGPTFTFFVLEDRQEEHIFIKVMNMRTKLVEMYNIAIPMFRGVKIVKFKG